MKNYFLKRSLAIALLVVALSFVSQYAYADYWVITYCGDLESYHAVFVISEHYDGVYLTEAGCD